VSFFVVSESKNSSL